MPGVCAWPCYRDRMPLVTRLLLCAVAVLAWGGILYVAGQPRTRWWVYGYLCAVLGLSLLALIQGDLRCNHR